jgi:hypothetical protein
MTEIVNLPEGTPIYREGDELGGPTEADQNGDQTGGLGAL